MATKHVGFLDNGDDDSSILVDCLMTSAADITANAGTLQSGATVSEDGVLAGSNGAVQFDLSALDYNSLDGQGYMHFDITTADIGELHESVGSVGYDHTGNDYLAHWNSSDGVIPPYGRILINTNEQLQLELNTSDSNAVIAGPHTLGVGTYTRVALSWIGGVTTHFINGYPVEYKDRLGFDLSKFRYIMLGALLNSSSPIVAPAKFKNFLISNRPVMIPAHRELTKVIFWGDSFVSNAAKAVSTSYYHCTAEHTFKRYLALKGIDAELVIDGHSGYEIWDGATSNLQSVRAALLAQDPRGVCVQAATNDALRSSLSANFEADYKDHITTIMAHASVEWMVLGTVPTTQANSSYDSVVYVNNVATLNGIIESLPSWWDTNNPTRVGKVTTANIFKAFGEESPPANVFVGQVNGLFSDLHPGAKGQAIMGETFAAAVLDSLD